MLISSMVHIMADDVIALFPMNILYIVNDDIENPSAGNSQRSRLVYDALCKIGNVYVLNVKKLQLLPQTGIKRVVNAVWQRLVINPCGECLVPAYPFPLRWSIEKLFPDVRFDVVVARYLFHVGMLSLWHVSPRLYVDIDDHPMQVFETIYGKNFKFAKRMWSRFVNGLFYKFVLKKLAGCWIANPDQVEMVMPYCKCMALENIPFAQSLNSNPKNYCKAARPEHSVKEEFLFTVGLMRYAPNYLGIDSFLNNVWPAVLSKYPELKYKIVGAGVPEKFLKSWSLIKNVEVLGYVDDLSELYNTCVATVVPVTSGSGTCIKTLESMLYSKICISTPFGARGLPADVLIDGRTGVVVYNSAEEFVSAVDRIRTDKCWLKESENAAANFVVKNYSRKKFEDTVIGLIKSGV